MLFTYRDNLMGAVSSSGRLITPPVYQSLRLPDEGAANRGLIAEKDNKFGYINNAGVIKVPISYTALYYNKEDFLTFKTATGTGAIDTSGLQVIEPSCEGIIRPKGGNCFLVTVNRGGHRLTGICDLKGNVIEEPVFQNYRPFGNEHEANEFYMFSRESIYRGTGMFNVRTLKWAFPCEYNITEAAKEYITVVNEQDSARGPLYGVFGRSGKFIIPVKYNSLEYIAGDKLATVSYNGKYGVVGANNTQLLPFKYELLISVQSPYNAGGNSNRLPAGYFIYARNGLKGVIDIHGKTTIAPVYKNLQATAAGLICSGDNITRIISPAGKVYITSDHALTYRTEGIFEWADSTASYGFDLYGRQAVIPPKPQRRNPWNGPDPSVMPPPVKPEDRIYEAGEVEEAPSFPGGRSEMMRFISENMAYPESAIENGLQGRCHISFVVGRDGSISDIEITKKLPDCPECDKASKDLIKKMPLWIPAKVNGRAVRCRYTLPIFFKL